MIQHELLQFLDKTEQILIGWLRLELANSDDRGQKTEVRGQRTEDRNWNSSICPLPFLPVTCNSQPVNQTRST